MKISGAFPSRFIKATDLNGEQLFTIDHVKIERMEETKEEIPTIYFREIQKGFVLNKTNGSTISAGYGDETDGWAGKPLVLFATTCDYKGNRVDCIRCRMPRDGEVENGGSNLAARF